MTKKSRRYGDELSFREAKPEPARVMELELLNRFRMRAGTSFTAGFGDCQNNEREMLLALTWLAGRETWYAAGAVRHGTQQVKLRGDRRDLGLPG